MNTDFSDWSQNVKIFMFHVQVYQKATLAEESLNTQRNTVTCLSTHHTPSPFTLILAQQDYEQSTHDGKDGGYTQARKCLQISRQMSTYQGQSG